MEGGDDEGGGGGGGREGHMDSDSSDSEVVGPPLPLGYEVLLLVDMFGTDVLSIVASVITFSEPYPSPLVLSWFGV